MKASSVVKELKTVFWTTLYFIIWFGALLLLKVIMLREYEVDIYGASIVLVGSLIAAKSVLILEHVPLSKSRTQPAIVEVLLRTLLYIAGIFILMVLEKSIEASHECGGFTNAVKDLLGSVNKCHIWSNIICVTGALLFYNIGSVVNDHIGENGVMRILRSPLPVEKTKRTV